MIKKNERGSGFRPPIFVSGADEKVSGTSKTGSDALYASACIKSQIKSLKIWEYKKNVVCLVVDTDKLNV